MSYHDEADIGMSGGFDRGLGAYLFPVVIGDSSSFIEEALTGIHHDYQSEVAAQFDYHRQSAGVTAP